MSTEPFTRRPTCTALDEEMATFRSRRLDHAAFPYLFCGATYVKGPVRRYLSEESMTLIDQPAADELDENGVSLTITA